MYAVSYANSGIQIMLFEPYEMTFVALTKSGNSFFHTDKQTWL